MTEHVIVSFTYNCNNDALVRVLNYLFIVSCGSSERLIWISEARVNRKGWWKLSPRIKITRSDGGVRACYTGDVLISIDLQSLYVCIKGKFEAEKKIIDEAFAWPISAFSKKRVRWFNFNFGLSIVDNDKKLFENSKYYFIVKLGKVSPAWQ